MGSAKGVPWGISESAYYKLDEAGNYQITLLGFPILRQTASRSPGHSPYSTFLALDIRTLESHCGIFTEWPTWDGWGSLWLLRGRGLQFRRAQILAKSPQLVQAGWRTIKG